VRSRAGFLSKQVLLTGHCSLSVPVLDFPSRKKVSTRNYTNTVFFCLVVVFGAHQSASLLVM